jgi:hypothetical protein
MEGPNSRNIKKLISAPNDTINKDDMWVANG